jgi:hypothetical protein
VQLRTASEHQKIAGSSYTNQKQTKWAFLISQRARLNVISRFLKLDTYRRFTSNWFEYICATKNVTRNCNLFSQRNSVQLQTPRADWGVGLTCVVISLQHADGGDHQQHMPPLSSGRLHKKDAIFQNEEKRIGGCSFGRSSYLQQQLRQHHQHKIHLIT